MWSENISRKVSQSNVFFNPKLDCKLWQILAQELIKSYILHIVFALLLVIESEKVCTSVKLK